MVKLGDEVKDSVSGFKGVAVARYSYLHGCDRICLQPKVDKSGELPNEKAFDEPRIIADRARAEKIGY